MNSILEIILLIIKTKKTGYSSFYYIYKKVVSFGYNIEKKELRYYLDFLINKTKNLKKDGNKYIVLNPKIRNSNLLIEDNFFDYINLFNKNSKFNNINLNNDSDSDSDSDSAIPVFIFGNKSGYESNDMESDEIENFFLNNNFTEAYSDNDDDDDYYENNNDDEDEFDYDFLNIFDEENYEVMTEFIKLTNDNEEGYTIYNLDDKPIKLLPNNSKSDDSNDPNDKSDSPNDKSDSSNDKSESSDSNDKSDSSDSNDKSDSSNDNIKIKMSLNIDKAKIFNKKKESDLVIPDNTNKINIVIELSQKLLDWLRKNKK